MPLCWTLISDDQCVARIWGITPKEAQNPFFDAEGILRVLNPRWMFHWEGILGDFSIALRGKYMCLPRQPIFRGLICINKNEWFQDTECHFSYNGRKESSFDVCASLQSSNSLYGSKLCLKVNKWGIVMNHYFDVWVFLSWLINYSIFI